MMGRLGAFITIVVCWISLPSYLELIEMLGKQRLSIHHLYPNQHRTVRGLVSVECETNCQHNLHVVISLV